MRIDRLLLAGIIALCALLGTTGIVSCTSQPGHNLGAGTETKAHVQGEVDPDDPAELGVLLDGIAGRRVVYVGELHQRYDHHLNQLAVIRGLNERGVKIAVGMEYFQEPFQRHLDAYGSGSIDEQEMLRRTEFFSRWRFDYRLYRGILEYARDHSIPLVALNAPTEMVEAVSEKGIAGLDPAYRGRLPAHVEPADADYERRLRHAFRMHSDLPEKRFKRFMEVQSVWDEYMARRAADYLNRHPDRTLVILVGAAHVLHDSAIPKRLRRYQAVDQAVIVTRPFEPLPGVAPDFTFSDRALALPAPGRMGMSLSSGGDDAVRVNGIEARGPAQRAGLQVGDRILRIGGVPVHGLSDVRVATMDHVPGDRVRVIVERGSGSSPERMSITLTLI